MGGFHSKRPRGYETFLTPPGSVAVRAHSQNSKEHPEALALALLAHAWLAAGVTGFTAHLFFVSGGREAARKNHEAARFL